MCGYMDSPITYIMTGAELHLNCQSDTSNTEAISPTIAVKWILETFYI